MIKRIDGVPIAAIGAAIQLKYGRGAGLQGRSNGRKLPYVNGIKPQICACGKRGTTRCGGDWICASCVAIDRAAKSVRSSR